MTSPDVTFFKSKSYFENESYLLESDDDATNASSLVNNELEQMSSAKNRPLQCMKALHKLLQIPRSC